MNKAKVTLSAAIFMAFAFTSGFSQSDTAYVPDTLKLILSGGSTPILQTRMQTDATYGYSLFSLSGKRIEPQSNVAEGVYLLIAKDASGKRHTAKVFHRGGSFNASAAFSQSGISPLMKDGDSEAWVVTAQAAGHVDTSYAFIPVKGMNALQIITLRPLAASSSSSLGGGASSSSSGLGTSSSSLGASSSSLESSSSSSSALANIAAVSVHVTTPAINETPDNAARTDDAGYAIGAVSWQPEHNPFQGGTIYTTTVTLSHAFSATLAKVVTGIAIKTQPGKLAYTHGEILNLAGLAVTVSYNDGTAQDIASADFDAYNINTDPSLGEAVSHSSHNGKGIKVGLGAHNAATSNLSVSKAAGAATSGGGNVSRTLNSITLTAATITNNPGDQTIEYAISTSTSTPTNGWQAEPSFSGLSSGTTYYAFVRSAANDNYNAGTVRRTNGIPTLGTCGETEYDPVNRLCDSRDNKLYKHVTIGAQTWMAENLDYNASGSRCYDNDTNMCDTYGRLYNWSTAMNNSASSSANPSGRGGVCPAGWHLPSDAEWDDLITAVGGSSTAGTKLKATSGWNPNATGISRNGTDNYGFAALPGGYGNGSYFINIGSYGGWWCATESGIYYAYARSMDSTIDAMDNTRDYVYRSSARDKGYLISVRCVKD